MPAGRSTFTKRQKEHNRLQKREEKAERKRQRALEKKEPGPVIDWNGAADQLGHTSGDDDRGE